MPQSLFPSHQAIARTLAVHRVAAHLLVVLGLGLAALSLHPRSAQAGGTLVLERSFEPRDGVAPAQLFVYSDDGLLIHSGQGSGAHEAGSQVELGEGWYWVEVGRFRTEYNLRRLYVADGQTTVVPSGWVSVDTLTTEQQPVGCDQWNAELTAFVVDESGQEHLVSSNQGTGVHDEGMLQLPEGEFIVYFHQFPSRVTIRAGQEYRLPVGFQRPVAGQRTQIALDPENTGGNIVMALCATGALHLPAGDYQVGRIIPTDTYPFEDRVWDRVSIPVDEGGIYSPIRAERVRNRYQGDGSELQLIDASYTEVLANYHRRSVSGGASSGFEGLLP